MEAASRKYKISRKKFSPAKFLALKNINKQCYIKPLKSPRNKNYSSIKLRLCFHLIMPRCLEGEVGSLATAKAPPYTFKHLGQNTYTF